MIMKWLYKIITFVFIFGLGWMFGLFVENWALFNLSFEVPAFSIINLLVISFLAWLVNYSIQNHSKRNKYKIDLLSGKMDEVDDNLKRIIELSTNNTGALYVEICILDKRNRGWTKEIRTIIEKHYSNVCSIDDLKQLDDNLLRLRSLLTYSPVLITDGNTPVLVEKDIVKYDIERQAEINVLVESTRHLLFKIKVGVSQK